MNPKELRDLYTSLWDKVPETRPTALDGCKLEWRKGAFRWIHPIVNSIDDDAAFALCRVAVEDWLAGRGLAVVPLKGSDRHGRWAVTIYGSLHVAGPAMDAPTTHHALIATALAEAGSFAVALEPGASA